jgi:hypothetical protein
MAAVAVGGGGGLLLKNQKPGPPFEVIDEANLKKLFLETLAPSFRQVM